jgi:predicted HicB family RNase H-like nuclease
VYKLGKVLLEINDDLHQKLRILAIKKKVTLKDLIISTLEEVVKENKEVIGS